MIPGCNRRLLFLATALGLATALLASGCLWGVVRDADTGAGISGATVTYIDSEGHSQSTTTVDGLYAFDIATGPVPAPGTATFEVTAPGYEAVTEGRLIEYDDNPHATLDNPSSFWEIQHFDLMPEGGQWIEVELLSVDIRRTLLAPPVAVSTDYIVLFPVYDPADPGGTLCTHESDWFPISSENPPPQTLSMLCAIPGDTLELMVYVGVRRRWQTATPPIPPAEEHDNSTATFEWTASSLETPWRTTTLDSTDAAGPDDPHMEFTAEIRYRSILAPPP
jgi:hypothetical protein